MFTLDKSRQRDYIGQSFEEILALPNLVEIQFNSYEDFLQVNRLRSGKPLERHGLEAVFQDLYPIESPNGDLVLEYGGYSIDFTKSDGLTPEYCKRKGITYGAPLKVKFNLIFTDTGEIRQKEAYFGEIPLITDQATFIVNGAERVVVSQIHRSPGVMFSHDKNFYAGGIIPNKGVWLEFELDEVKELLYIKIDRKKKILATTFLRALGYPTTEDILNLLYEKEAVPVTQDKLDNPLVGRFAAKKIMNPAADGDDEDQAVFLGAGRAITPHDLDELTRLGIKEVEVLILGGDNPSGSHVILNCIAQESILFSLSQEGDNPTRKQVVTHIYSVLFPGSTVTIDAAENDIQTMFFSPRRYTLGEVGRYKLNKKYNYDDPSDIQVLEMRDIVRTMLQLIQIFEGHLPLDDIDHLGNRRIRSVGELLSEAVKAGLTRVEKVIKERMVLLDKDGLVPPDLISVKPVTMAIKDMFATSQLSQFMDQVNPLAGLTHKRRLNALGDGGLSRDRAGFEVRDVHYTHYAKMCPIETPEGPNIGLILSLVNFARVNRYGFLEAPYRKVVDGRVTRQVEYLSAVDEDRYYIAQASAPFDKDGNFLNKNVAVRKMGDYTVQDAKDVSYIDVSPHQIISTATSLIPFLEHDDANRALMGANMQRQAVPVLFPESAIVGTGMERYAAGDSGVLIKSHYDGTVDFVSSTIIRIRDAEGIIHDYPLVKYSCTNQNTCFNQRPIVTKGEEIKKGDILADGPATRNGELALGRNLLVGFMPWNGYNYEDAVLMSQRVVREDYYTSVHIKEFEVEVRETKLGPERITRDLPSVSEKAIEDLDEEGIIRIGAYVHSRQILVGKVMPRSDVETTPEFKLLNAIFGEKARDVKDASLKLPHGAEGTVIDIQRLKKSEGDNLNPGVEEVVKIYVAAKRSLKVGDKMAGRHGNKGVVARILPEEDMPYLEDGTPLDVCLNPLGVPSRMNIGQLMENMLGIAGAKLGKMYQTPTFLSGSIDDIENELEKAGLERSGKAKLYDGRTGEPFKNEVSVGYTYYLKLHHLVDDKMHARSTGPYSLVTQQPLGGKAQFGGQRLGEMEVWALEAYGASSTLQELVTIKSDDMKGRSKVYESIVKGEAFHNANVPESFNVLLQELRGLSLDVEVFDEKGRKVPLTDKDRELLERNKSDF